MLPRNRVSLTVLAAAAVLASVAAAQGTPTGHVLIWGANGNGQLGDAPAVQRSTPLQVPATGNLRSIAAGYAHVLVRHSDGTVWAWGEDYYGQLGDGTWVSRSTPGQVPGLAGAVAIGAGVYHSLAVRTDGTVWSWGWNDYGQLGDGTRQSRSVPMQIEQLGEVVAVAGGTASSYALRTNGTVWSWGWNVYGQLGDGTTADRLVPTPVDGLTGVVAIAAAATSCLALKDDGTVWSWGNNIFGQLGDGTRVNRPVPVQVQGLTGVLQISCGAQHCLALLSDGTVRAWGRNVEGELGDGTFDRRLLPVPVQGLAAVTVVDGGYFHSLAKKADGTVWTWGGDYCEECDELMAQNVTPVQVQGMPNALAVTGGNYFSVALASDGSAWSWGYNDQGQLGDGRELYRPLPAILAGAPLLTTVALGEIHSLALDAGGTVWSWGDGVDGETGHGRLEFVSAPAPVGGMGTARAVAVGHDHSMAIASDGTVWAWGWNGFGKLGNDAMDWTATPTQVAGIAGAGAVACGADHSVVALGDGSAWAWGANAQGQLGDGTVNDSAAPVQVLGLTNVTALASPGWLNYTLALKGDGTVWGWGGNSYGQLGDGTTTNRSTPVQVVGLTGIVRIAVAGGWHSSYALGADGTLWSWGDNQQGQLGNGTASSDPQLVPAPIVGLPTVIRFSAGDGHVVAQTSDGRVWTWGDNGSSQLGLGDFEDRWQPTEVAGLSGVVGVSAGGDNTAVIVTCDLGCAADVPVAGHPGVAVPFSATTTTTSGCIADPSFDWDFGDGSLHSSEQNPSHAFAGEGTFHWVLTVTSDGQNCTKEGDITITYPCTVACSASAPGYVQANTPAAFAATATPSHCAGSPGYDWNFGDGSGHDLIQNPAHTYVAAGMFTWTLTVSSGDSSCTRSGQITVLGPACTGGYNLIIPATAHSNNAWQSDLDLYNVGTMPASVDIALLKPGQANLSPAAMNVAVLPGQTLRIPDILGTLLPAANAALGIRFCSGSALVNSRFYNIGTAKTGTFGAIVPALPPSAAITPTTRGVFHHLTYSPDPKTGYRVNLGFANASPFSVSVTVRLYGDDGELLGTKTLSVRAYEQSRLDKIHQTLGTGPVAHGAATVEVNTANAVLHAYALLIDNVSGDPAFMAAELVPR